jgi:hypothetical protein
MASTCMIKRLWNDRRGVSAWVVTIAMVPLLGMLSLGTEVGSWCCRSSFRQVKWFCDRGWLCFGNNRSERLHYLFRHGRSGQHGHGDCQPVRDADLHPMVRSERSGQDTGHSSCHNTNKARVLYARTRPC